MTTPAPDPDVTVPPVLIKCPDPDCSDGLIRPEGKPVTYHQPCGGTGRRMVQFVDDAGAHAMARARTTAQRRTLARLCCDEYTASGGFAHQDDCAGVVPAP